MGKKLTVASFFAGAGGLDLGFHQAGFDVPWANEYDKSIWATYEHNFPQTTLDRRSIADVDPGVIPDVDGFVGGPPCQSWSEAGALRGIDDERGRLFFDYVDLLAEKSPKFFLAENVSGILFNRHSKAFEQILESFARIGYNVSYGLVNSVDYGVPQVRQRVFIVGYRTEFNKFFLPPDPSTDVRTLKDAIWDLRKSGKPAGESLARKTDIPNHEYLTGGFSTIYMSRNRVRAWDEPSFTIQAGGRHAPLHPQAPRMIKQGPDKWIFDPSQFSLYRRLTVREAARVQTFPDTHVFLNTNVSDGYKMVGNAVPVELARRIAEQINRDIGGSRVSLQKKIVPGAIRRY